MQISKGNKTMVHWIKLKNCLVLFQQDLESRMMRQDFCLDEFLPHVQPKRQRETSSPIGPHLENCIHSYACLSPGFRKTLIGHGHLRVQSEKTVG